VNSSSPELNRSVSVCMIVRNSSGLLGATIESVLNQTGLNIEFIIVDNNSTDDSFEQCLKYGNSDSRIKLHRSEEQRGESLDQLLRRASYQFLLIIRPGDILDPSALDELSRVLETNPQVAITACGRRLLARQDKLIRTDPPMHSNQFVEGTKIIDQLSLDVEQSLPPLACTMFRRSGLVFLLDGELQRSRKIDLWYHTFKQQQNSLYFGLDQTLVSIRFFDYWEEDNVANESLTRLAEFSTFGTIRSSLSLKNKDDQLNFQIDKLGRHLIQNRIRDLPACLRALNEQLQRGTSSETASLLDSQLNLFLNRMRRTNHLKKLHDAAEQDFERLNQEIAEISLQTNKVLESKSWKLGTIIRAKLNKS
jgi:glycosyltransferase involved in cell wall biosynthesis